MKEDDMVANKLSALLTRKKFASRDVFDLHFFLKENWQIDERVIKEKIDMSLAEALQKAHDRVKTIRETELLAELGELLEDEKQKAWVKDKLQEELLFLLKLYLSNAFRRQERVA